MSVPLRELIGNIEAMVDHITADPTQAHSPACIEYLVGHGEIAYQLSSRITAAVDNANAQGSK